MANSPILFRAIARPVAVAALAAVILWSPIDAAAQFEPPSRVLTLAEAQDLALTQNLELQSAQESVAALATLSRQVRAQWLPQAVLFANYIHNDHETVFDIGSSFEPLIPWIVGVSLATGVVPPDFGESEPAVIQHQDDYQAGGSISMTFTPQWLLQEDTVDYAHQLGEAGLDEARLMLGMAVTDLYYALVALREARDVSIRNIETRQVSLEYTQARVELGVSTTLNLLQSQLALTEAEAQLRRIDFAFVRLRFQVGQILQTEPDFDVARPTPPTMLTNIGTAYESALEQRPDIRGAHLNIELTETASDEVRWSWSPAIQAAFNVAAARTTAFNDESVRWNITVGLAWPIFLGAVRLAQLDQREAEEMAARFQSEEAATQVNLELEQAFLNRQEIELDLELAIQQRELAASALDVANALKDEGLGTQLDILTAESALFGAEIAITQNEIALEQQNARIHSLTGELWRPTE